MKLIAAICSMPYAVFILFTLHDLTEPPGPDDDTEWRTAAGWAVLVLVLLAMLAITIAGVIDERARIDAEARAAGKHPRRRHRIRYADGPAATLGTREQVTVRAYDRAALPVLEEPTPGGTR